MINKCAHMHEGWTGWLLFEQFPGRQVGVWRHDKELIQCCTSFLGEFLRHLAVESARGDRSDMVSSFVERGKWGQLKAVFGKGFECDIDQIGNIFFGSSDADHGFECAGTRSRAVRLDPPRCSDEGNMTLPCTAGVVGLQIRNMQGGINEFNDMVENRERHVVQRNKTTQTLVGFKEDEKANLCYRTFC